MEGQKIEIDVCNSLAAMAYVVADQQRMFKEKDLKIQELEKKCQNFASNVVNLDEKYKNICKQVEKQSVILKEQSEMIETQENKIGELNEKIPTWESIEVDDSKGNIKAFPKEGKWLVRFVIHEDYKGSYFDAFGITCISGMTAYIGIDTKEKAPIGLPKCINAEALYLGEFM